MTTKPLFRAGIVLGIGLGGFLDGILLHQILGWHHLICTTPTCQPDTIATLQEQNRLDGFFHLGVWCVTAWGVALLFRARTAARDHRGSARVLLGGLVAGWGWFNLVEGLIDHQLLGLHHVNPGSSHWLAWDVTFLGFAVALIVTGWWLRRSAGRPNGEAEPQPVT